MLPCAIKRIVICQHRVDFRKGFNGLLAECYKLSCDPYEGICVVFLKADKTQLRILVGDACGLYLVSRRFEKGTLKPSWLITDTKSPSQDPTTISHGELSLLFEGTNYIIKKKVKPWRKYP